MKITINTDNPEVVESFFQQFNFTPLQGGTQNKHRQAHYNTNSGRAIPRVVSVALPEKDYDIENKGKDLAKILRRDCKSMERVVQHLTKKEKENRHLRKIGQESYESLLLSQSANLLWLLSEHVIPQLER